MRLKKILGILRKAIGDSNHDYTQMNVKKAVILLAVPMILELSLESVFAVIDMFFVSHLGENAIATVGLTEAALTLIYSIAIGMSIAATALIARRVGEKKIKLASFTSAQIIIVTLALSVFLMIIGLLFSSNVLRLLGASKEVIKEGNAFSTLMISSSGIILFLFVINGVFRGAGNASIAMKSLWIASLINIILCPICIYFFGLLGAAFATIFGRSIGVLFQFRYLFERTHILKIKKQYFKIRTKIIRNIFTIATPAMLQFLIQSGSWVIITKLIAEIGGTHSSAGFQIAFRCIAFFIMPAWGLSNVVATLVGQHLGAKQIDKAEQSIWITTKYNFIFMAGVSLLFLTCAKWIALIFTKDPFVLEPCIQSLRIIGGGFIVFGTGITLIQAINGAGDTKTPTVINLICFWFIQAPLAFILAKYFDLKTLGVLIAVPSAEAIYMFVVFYFVKNGYWKNIKI